MTVDAVLVAATQKKRGAAKQKRDAAAIATASLEKSPGDVLLYRRKASTIGAAGLNFSVRNGKRCCPRAIATRRLGAGIIASEMSDIMVDPVALPTTVGMQAACVL